MPTAKDFGIETTAMSNATGPLQSGPDLSALLPPVGEAAQLQSAIQQLQAQEPTSPLERLLSPSGLILALGSLLAGKETGGLGAAAFGLGGLQGLQAQAVKEQEDKAAAVAQLQKQRDDALDRVDKAQQRVATAFNTNPDAFTDPETGEPVMEPEDLGALMFGFPVKMFPQTRRKLAQADQEQQNRHEVLSDQLKNAQSVADARQIFKAMYANMGWYDAPNEVTDALARAAGTQDWTPTMANIIAQNASNPHDVFTFAAENRLPLEDYEVQKRIDWIDKPVDMPTKSDVDLLLVQRLNEWLRQNRDVAGELRKQSASNAEFYRLAADRAFAEEPASAQQVVNFLKVNESEMVRLLDSYGEVLDNADLANMIAGINKLSTYENMTDEERARYNMKLAVTLDEAKKKVMLEDMAKQDAAYRNGIKQRLIATYPGRFGAQTVRKIMDHMYGEAAKAATQPDGRIDRAKFEAAVNAEFEKLQQDLGE